MRTLTKGDVVAIAVDGVRVPPVGMISDLSDESVKLALYHWLACRFIGSDIQVRRRDIRATIWAEPFTPAQLARLGIEAEDGEPVWDMDPLSDFQSDWKQRV